MRMSLKRHDTGRTLLDLIFEVVLIAVGVFLALWANNWHEDHEHRAQARAALQNFVKEMENNRAAIDRNRAYHETLARELEQFVSSRGAPTEDRFEKDVHYAGARPVIFERTAWDLALATQALSYLKPQLAFDISKVYTEQNAFQTLENSFLTAAYSPAALGPDNAKAFATSMKTYLGDVNQLEPAMLQRYDEVIPEIKQELGTASDR